MARVIFTNTDPGRWMSIRTEISGTGAGDQARVLPSQSWGPPGNYPTGTEMRFWWRFEREDIENCDAPPCGLNRIPQGRETCQSHCLRPRIPSSRSEAGGLVERPADSAACPGSRTRRAHLHGTAALTQSVPEAVPPTLPEKFA